MWHSTDKYKRVIYRCNHKYGNNKTCETPHITEDEIKEIVVKAINKVVADKKEIIENIKLVINTLCDNKVLEEKKIKLENELNNIVELTESFMQKNTKVAQNQVEYNKKYNKLIDDYDIKKKEYDAIVDKINMMIARKEMLTKYIKDLKETNLIKEFDETLFITFIDFITIYTKDDIRVTFKDGIEIKI